MLYSSLFPSFLPSILPSFHCSIYILPSSEFLCALKMLHIYLAFFETCLFPFLYPTFLIPPYLKVLLLSPLSSYLGTPVQTNL